MKSQKKFISGSKTIKFVGLKSIPSKPSDVQLAKINQFTRRSFSADEIYVGQLRLANNCIDRDNERFSEGTLQRFADTAVRKTMLFDHNRQAQVSAIGKYFDVEIEKMPLQQAIAETGEELQLPDGMSEVQFLSPWFYIPVNGVEQEVIVKIDAGIYDFASIGFRTEPGSLVPIMDKEGDIRFYEYQGFGKMTEMTEGSLVYLGAQYGMVVKSYGEADDDEKSAVSFSPTTMADEGLSWDAAAAKQRLAKWASSDGSGDKDTIDWAKYRKGFAWYDSEDSENFGAYKLPHHDIVDGEISVIWKGVAAAMAALMGGRGGVDMPTEDKDSCYNHLSKHYKQFDKEPPEKAFDIDEKNRGGKKNMDKILKMLARLFPGKSFTEDAVAEELKAAVDAEKSKAVEDATAPLSARIKELAPLEAKVKEIEPLAADGKAYRESMVADYVTMKAKLGDVSEKPEDQAELKTVAAAYPMKFLKTEVETLRKRVEEKFPAGSQIAGDDPNDKRGPGGKKNALIPEEK